LTVKNHSVVLLSFVKMKTTNDLTEKLDAKNYLWFFSFYRQNDKMKSLNNFKDKTWIKVLQTTTKDTCSFREQIVN